MKKNVTVLDEVKNIISEVLEVSIEELNENTNLLRDLGAESLDLVDLVAEFESKYNFEIPDQDIKGLQTIGDVVSYIESHNKNV